MINNTLKITRTSIKYFISIIIAFLVINGQGAKAGIINSYSITSAEIKEIEEWVDKDTLIFIEIDNTLMIPKSLMFSRNSNPYSLFIENLIAYGKRIPSYNKSVAKWYEQRRVKLVEDDWVDLINRLKAKTNAVYGLCSMPIHLINIEEKRYNEAKDLKVIFSDTINKQDDMLIGKKEGWPTHFYKGILFTGALDKSKALLEFLRVSSNVPPKMLVITSITHEAKNIERALRIFNMDYRVIFYSGAKEIVGIPNAAIAQLQQRELIENNRWLEDDAAAQQLESLKSSLKEK